MGCERELLGVVSQGLDIVRVLADHEVTGVGMERVAG